MLIKCPECGKEIADKSKCCIHCGFPLNEISNNKNKNGLFNLVLTSFGNDKIKTIKIIRETTGFGLAEAKDVVDNVPCIFFKGIPYEKCNEIKSKFNNYGAIIEIVDDSYNISDLKKDIKIQSQIHCPYCNSTNVNKLSSTKKALSIIGFGILSNKIGKQWHCNNCKSDF